MIKCNKHIGSTCHIDAALGTRCANNDESRECLIIILHHKDFKLRVDQTMELGTNFQADFVGTNVYVPQISMEWMVDISLLFS